MVTKYQKSLMELTKSGQNMNWTSFKEGTKEFAEFEKLIDMGLAYKNKFMGNTIFSLTVPGLQLLFDDL